MSRTKAQAQLRYFEAMSRITQLEILAEQLQKLAVSYGQQERAAGRMVHESTGRYGESDRERPSVILHAQAAELRAVASAWHREAHRALEQETVSTDRGE